VFGKAANTRLQDVKECVALWLTYGNTSSLRTLDRNFLTSGTRELHKRCTVAGDTQGVHLAQQASRELGIPLQPTKTQQVRKTPQRNGSQEGKRVGNTSTVNKAPVRGKSKRYKRKKYRCPDVSNADTRKAKSLVSKGVRAFRKKNRRKALRNYLAALERDPCHLSGLYNAAAEYAYDGQEENAVQLLQRLQDIATKGALKRLKAARTDRDFEPIHDSPGFKKSTGFARLKLVNSLINVKGYDLGEHELDRIQGLLKQLSMPVEEVGVDKVQGRKRPVVFYKRHSITTAYVLGEVVGHPKTVFREISPAIYPDWTTDYDIIVTWGNKIVMRDGEPAPAMDLTDTDPAKQEKKIDNLMSAQDKALRKPEQTARKVDHAVGTPERIQNKAERSIDRTKRTVDKVGNTMDKIGNL